MHLEGQPPGTQRLGQGEVQRRRKNLEKVYDRSRSLSERLMAATEAVLMSNKSSCPVVVVVVVNAVGGCCQP